MAKSMVLKLYHASGGLTKISDSVSLGWGLRISVTSQMILMFLAQEPNFEKHWARQESGDQYWRLLIKGNVQERDS